MVPPPDQTVSLNRGAVREMGNGSLRVFKSECLGAQFRNMIYRSGREMTMNIWSVSHALYRVTMNSGVAKQKM